VKNDPNRAGILTPKSHFFWVRSRVFFTFFHFFGSIPGPPPIPDLWLKKTRFGGRWQPSKGSPPLFSKIEVPANFSRDRCKKVQCSDLTFFRRFWDFGTLHGFFEHRQFEKTQLFLKLDFWVFRNVKFWTPPKFRIFGPTRLNFLGPPPTFKLLNLNF
jgi:hypothetical protein